MSGFYVYGGFILQLILDFQRFSEKSSTFHLNVGSYKEEFDRWFQIHKCRSCVT